MSRNLLPWFVNKLGELANDSDRKSALLEIKSVTTSLDKGTVSEIARNVPLNAVFDCLNNSDEEEIELASSIIFNLLQHLGPIEELNLYGNLLLRALTHPSAHVKISVLRLLERMVETETLGHFLAGHSELLVQATECLASPDRSIAQGAIKMLTKMGQSLQGLTVLYSDVIVGSLKKVMSADDTSRFRVYEIMVAVSERSVEGLQASQMTGLLPSLLAELKSTDSLIQLNVLEILTALSACNHGLLYLQESGVIQYLVDKILKIEEEPLSFVLLPGLIEFFGNLYKLQPKQFSEKYPQVLDLLFKSIDTPDPVLLGVIVSTIGKIGSTNNGKKVLNHDPSKMKIFLEKAGHLLLTKNDTTVTVMNSLSELINTSDNDIALSEVTRVWFHTLGPNALQTLVSLAKLPFVELRLAALVLLKSVAKQTWGTEKLCNYPGMVEYLIDRSTEFDKECKNTKYDISVEIVNSPVVSQVLAGEVLIKLREFVTEGPFYVATQPEMAFEGAS